MEQAIYASVISDTAEREAICNRIRQVQSEMHSVIVKSESVREYGEGPERESEEWGYSGEKLFLRRQWPSKIGEPASDRFQIGTWDGKQYKLYDTQTQTGSVRSSYDLQSSVGVPFLITSIYARFFGTFSEGSLTQLLDRMPPETWRFERDESDSTICVSLDWGGVVDRWWLDPGKNYMVKRHEVTSVDRNTKEIRVRVVTEAVEAKEVRPGIWLPTRISELGTFRDRPAPTKTDVVVQEVKVNDPNNERVFDWQFPKDGTFYDYTIGKAVVPGKTDEALGGVVVLLVLAGAIVAAVLAIQKKR
jgi:hypothetical protein